MLRLALLVSPPFLVACAAPRTNALLVSDSAAATTNPARAGAADPRPDAPGGPAAVAAIDAGGPAAEPAPAALASAPQEGESLYKDRFTLKGGYYGAKEDALDDGYIFNLSWMSFRSKFLAVEFEAGYLDADGRDSGVEAEIWSLPFMVNGRLNAPIWILDVYGGLGVGAFYYDVEISGGATGDDDGFVMGGNAFVGATLNVADRIALGLEGKYYVTEEADDLDESLDAFALMLTLGFSR